MTSIAGLRVAHFGGFDPDYSRNRTIRKALERAGATVETISVRAGARERWPELARQLRRTAFDLVLVAYPAHSDVPLARAIAARRRAPIVFDALVSMYDSSVVDREVIPRRSLSAWRLLAEDRLACRAAHAILVDSNANIDFMVDRLGAPRSRCRRVWVGADDELVRPNLAARRATDGRLQVLFYGSFIPLHGVEHILRAAAIVESRRDGIGFTIVGDGQTESEAREIATALALKNTTFINRKPYLELIEMVRGADICLGIFGTSGKAQRVIPNKVYDALAAARPVITADTAGVREALTHGEHAWLCPPGDPAALAAAIETLADDVDLRARLGAAGHRLFAAEFGLDALSRRLTGVLSPLVRVRSPNHGIR